MIEFDQRLLPLCAPDAARYCWLSLPADNSEACGGAYCGRLVGAGSYVYFIDGVPVVDDGLGCLRVRLRRRQTKPRTAATIAAAPTPAPMPALAPVLRPPAGVVVDEELAELVEDPVVEAASAVLLPVVLDGLLDGLLVIWLLLLLLLLLLPPLPLLVAETVSVTVLDTKSVVVAHDAVTATEIDDGV